MTQEGQMSVRFEDLPAEDDERGGMVMLSMCVAMLWGMVIGIGAGWLLWG